MLRLRNLVFRANQIRRVACHMSPPAKHQKMSKVIGTHSGGFHCDEALGCYLLKQLPEFAEAEIVRSRDPKVLDTCNIILDVGGTYEPGSELGRQCAEKQRFDHHQRGFEEVFPGFGTKLSSAGLIYKHYGKAIVAKIMGLSEDHADVQTVYLATYKKFMEAIDAVDNGINQWDGPQAPKYINNTHLSARVGQLTPDWNEDQSNEVMDGKFRDAMALTGKEFEEAVLWIGKVWLPARAFVREAVEKRKSVDKSGEIILLETVCPWKEHLYELEEEMGVEKPLKYCLFEDTKEKKYRVQAVNVPGSFESRKPLPAAWRGVRDNALSELSGIPGCVFVHASGFIGGNATYEGALAMARQGLKE